MSVTLSSEVVPFAECLRVLADIVEQHDPDMTVELSGATAHDCTGHLADYTNRMFMSNMRDQFFRLAAHPKVLEPVDLCSSVLKNRSLYENWLQRRLKEPYYVSVNNKMSKRAAPSEFCPQPPVLFKKPREDVVMPSYATLPPDIVARPPPPTPALSPRGLPPAMPSLVYTKVPTAGSDPVCQAKYESFEKPTGDYQIDQVQYSKQREQEQAALNETRMEPLSKESRATCPSVTTAKTAATDSVTGAKPTHSPTAIRTATIVDISKLTPKPVTRSTFDNAFKGAPPGLSQKQTQPHPQLQNKQPDILSLDHLVDIREKGCSPNVAALPIHQISASEAAKEMQRQKEAIEKREKHKKEQQQKEQKQKDAQQERELLNRKQWQVETLEYREEMGKLQMEHDAHIRAKLRWQIQLELYEQHKARINERKREKEDREELGLMTERRLQYKQRCQEHMQRLERHKQQQQKTLVGAQDQDCRKVMSMDDLYNKSAEGPFGQEQGPGTTATITAAATATVEKKEECKNISPTTTTTTTTAGKPTHYCANQSPPFSVDGHHDCEEGKTFRTATNRLATRARRDEEPKIAPRKTRDTLSLTGGASASTDTGAVLPPRTEADEDSDSGIDEGQRQMLQEQHNNSDNDILTKNEGSDDDNESTWSCGKDYDDIDSDEVEWDIML
ncbi:hypothetical protein GMORB2_1291 [Geosmithia morbida]|uniref:Uncharacterized protein n=1 Tax=Geosmithia morbida TaxID=1094350 RepID=A0A9P4Z015_9HYPO|nr:uncharacterized protein GMORB2_1291 [Geosmithia morbida]KAF4126045.1 hypothetical protein GMORB2_1291 [Geosmithia morbida]